MKRRSTIGCLLACAFLAVGNCGAQQYVISTVVGGAPPQLPAFSLFASIGSPKSIATDSTGNAYFTSINCVFQLTPGGILFQIAGTSRAGYSGDGGSAFNAQLSSPAGLAVDSSGDIFVADSGNNRVREISSTGVITTVAGSGVAGFSGDGGPAVSAQLSGVSGVAIDSSGNIFIADTGNNRIRKVTPAGVITTVAGNGKSAFAGDNGPAISAQTSAVSVAVDAAGDIFIGDAANYRVRKVTLDGNITTIAGTGTPGFSGDGSGGLSAQLSSFNQIWVDQLGNVFIADTGNSSIREVSSGSGTIRTVAGNGKNGYFGDSGNATVAALAFPSGVALDPTGDLFIADSGNYRIREVGTNGEIITAAGSGVFGYSGDGGAAASAQLFSPQGVGVDRFGNLFVADTGNNVIREVQANGPITTIAGTGVIGSTGDGGSGTRAQFSGPQGVVVDGGENIFIADTGNNRIRELADSGLLTFAGNGNANYTGDGGQASSSSLSVAAIAVDGTGNLYVADPFNFRIREITTSGTIMTVAGNGVRGFSGDGGTAVSAQLSAVGGVAVDSSGNVYIADSGNNRVRKVSSSGTITTIAGNGIAGFSGDGGQAVNAQLNIPTGLAVDATGNVFISDTNNNRIREVTASGIITTIAGNGSALYTGDGGGGAVASLSHPAGLALGKSGTLYVADTGNNAIRLLTPSATSAIIGLVVDAASESTAPLSPGKIAVIYGTGLGPSQLVVNQPVNGSFGAQLAGTTVSFRGILAPIYYTSSTQVAAIVPYEISGSSSVPVQVSYQNQTSTQFNVPFAAVSPGFFTANASGAGQLAAINVKDGTLNSATNPVKIGDYIELYATGEGQTSPAGVDGKLDPLTVPIPAPLQKVTAKIGGMDATVSYAECRELWPVSCR